MKVVLVCDPPVGKLGQNVGGVHAVVARIQDEMTRVGHHVSIVSGAVFEDVPAGMSAYKYVSNLLDSIEFDAIHIVTQTRLGLLARRYCHSRKLSYTCTYDTLIPEYLEVRHGVPAWVGYVYMRWFLNGAERVIVPTPTLAKQLTKNGVKNVISSLHGVDTDMFAPGDKSVLDDLPRPIWLYVGRITPEKNVQAFLDMKVPGTKVLVGGVSGGLVLEDLQEKYPEAVFVGVRKGAELASYYRAGDVFVFPSKTDTFGLVMLEAMASGLPVAAFPVTGPIDVVTDPRVGCLDENLEKAALAAAKLSPQDCRDFALKHTWTESISRFASMLVPCRPAKNRSVRLRKWLDRTVLNVPQVALEKVVGKTATILFAAEPAGPYSGRKQA